MTYTPATQDQLLAIRVNAGIEELAQSERFAAAEPDMVEAIVGGIGEFAAGEWAPLNRVGDLEGAKLENGVVRLTCSSWAWLGSESRWISRPFSELIQ